MAIDGLLRRWLPSPLLLKGWAALSTWELVRNADCSTLDLPIRVAFWQDCRVNLSQWSLRSPDLSTQASVLWSFWYFYSEKKNKIRQPRFSRRSIFATGHSRKLPIFIIRSFIMDKTGGVSSTLMKSHAIVLQVEGDQQLTGRDQNVLESEVPERAQSEICNCSCL